MPKRIALLSVFVLMGLSCLPASVSAQALVPYTLQLDATELEQQGLSLLQDAVHLAQFQQFERALPTAQLSTQLAPKNFKTWFLLGTLYVQAKELDKGIEALQKSRSLAPNESGVLFSLGSAYFQKGDYTTSASMIETGLKLKPDLPEAWFDLGNAYYMLGKFPDAIAQYEKAVKKEPKFWPAINNVGLVKYETGDLEAAIRQWETAIAINKQEKKEETEPQLALAVALYAKGDRDRALALGEAAIKLDSRYADLKFLKENLWGNRLLGETKKFLETPKIQATIAEAKNQSSEPQLIPR